MALNAGDMLDLVRDQLSDNDATKRWSDPALFQYMTVAQRLLVQLRPDANAQIKTIQLAGGSQQSVPATAYRFMGGVRNMGQDGATPGKAVRNTDMATKDEYDPDWMEKLGELAVIDECVFDAQVPTVFWVSPAVPTTTNVHLAIRVSELPGTIDDTTDDFDVPEIYQYPLLLLILHLAYAENTGAGNKQLSQGYLQQARQALGLKSQIEGRLPPAAKTDGA